MFGTMDHTLSRASFFNASEDERNQTIFHENYVAYETFSIVFHRSQIELLSYGFAEH